MPALTPDTIHTLTETLADLTDQRILHYVLDDLRALYGSSTTSGAGRC
ncbi:hypothetical protein [Streptomyces antibioticus]